MQKPQAPKTEEMVQIVVSNFPVSLLKQIDELAKEHDRARAAEIRKLLAEAVAQRHSEAAAA